MTSKTKLLKQGKYTPEAAHAAATAPAKKAEYSSNPENKGKFSEKKKAELIRSEVIARNRAANKKRLLKKGLNEDEIKEFEKIENLFAVLCIHSGHYQVKDGTTKQKKVNGQLVTVDNILRGTRAILFTLNEKFGNNIKILSESSTHVYLNTDKKHLKDVIEFLDDVGRVTYFRWKEEAILKMVQKPEKRKKPSNNSKEVAAKAKKARENAKREAIRMRPFYAARRNGGVSLRIKTHNPKLAAEIEAWLSKQEKREKRPKRGTGKGPSSNDGVTTNRIRKLTLRLVKKKKEAERKASIREAEHARMIENDKKRKAKNVKEGELKIAA